MQHAAKGRYHLNGPTTPADVGIAMAMIIGAN